MKKIFLLIVLFYLIIIFFAPFLAKATGPLVPCTDDCTIDKFKDMLGNIYTFIVTDIAAPLAVISLIVGGACILASAGNPGLMGLGKKIVYAAIIGLVLALGSYAVINFILSALGGSSLGS
jgi:type IV secretory pathway VirB2 component (pilin)